MTNVILAGNAITADILYSYLKSDNRYTVVGLTVDDEYLNQGGIEDIETYRLSALKESWSSKQCVVVMAMGYNDLNRSRESMFLRIKEMGYKIETYIHPDAGVYTENELGEGSVVLPSAIIEPHSSVGSNTMVWCNVTLAHHSSIAENCWISSGAVVSGQARIKRNSFIGVNATIVNNVTVEENNIIGGGAFISKDTKPSTVHLARSGEEMRFSSQDYERYFGV